MIEDEVVRIRITHPFSEKARVATIDVPFTRAELLDPNKADERDRIIKATITETELMFKDFDQAMGLVDPIMRLAPAAPPGPPAQQPPAVTQGQTPAPVCDICNQTKYWKQGGVSQKTGKQYNGFWACGNYQNHPPQPQQQGPVF